MYFLIHIDRRRWLIIPNGLPNNEHINQPLYRFSLAYIYIPVGNDQWWPRWPFASFSGLKIGATHAFLVIPRIVQTWQEVKGVRYSSNLGSAVIIVLIMAHIERQTGCGSIVNIFYRKHLVDWFCVGNLNGWSVDEDNEAVWTMFGEKIDLIWMLIWSFF